MTVKVEDNRKNLDDLFKELDYLDSHVIVVGVLGDKEVDEVSVQEYAIYVEFGTENKEGEEHIPARPFFREATQTTEARKKISKYMKNEMEKVIESKKTGKQACNAVGEYVRGLIVKSIKEGDWVPNAPSTVKQKGKNNPLIDTTTLIKSIDYEIRRK